MSELTPGDPAPEFELADATGKVWRLADLRGDKVIVYFYPADDTPGCTAQACDFRDSSTDLTAAGYRVFGVSPQGAKSHQRFSDKYGLNFPLLVDTDMAAATAFGVADPKGGKYGDIPLRVKRSTFVIDETGRIESAEYGVKARGHVEKLKMSLGLQDG